MVYLARFFTLFKKLEIPVRFLECRVIHKGKPAVPLVCRMQVDVLVFKAIWKVLCCPWPPEIPGSIIPSCLKCCDVTEIPEKSDILTAGNYSILDQRLLDGFNNLIFLNVFFPLSSNP